MNVHRILKDWDIEKEKFALIGRLSAGIIHEINNPVGFLTTNISTFDDYMKDFLPLIKKYREMKDLGKTKYNSGMISLIQEIENTERRIKVDLIVDDILPLVHESLAGIKRIGELLNCLREFLNFDEENRKYINVNDEIKRALFIVRNELKYNAEIATELEDVPRVRGDRSAMSIFFVILLLVIAEHLTKGSNLVVHTFSSDSLVFLEMSFIGESNVSDIRSSLNSVHIGDVSGAHGILRCAAGLMCESKVEIDVFRKGEKETIVSLSFPVE